LGLSHIFCIIRKDYKKILFEKLNNFDEGLKFTTDSMENNKLVFLDTLVVNTNGKLHSAIYKKPKASETLLNFKNIVAPKSQKVLTLIGEIYRCQNITTTPEALKLA
jgi:hypothetical protein